MKILITGFDPFGNETINPAWEAVKNISDVINGVSIIKFQIPTVFRESIDKLLDVAKQEKPDFILCVGQAGGRFDLTIERVGINIDDARIADNKKNQPIDEAIYEDGDNAYFVKLPIKNMMQGVRDIGIPCSISNTAGTFVCNHILYALLYHIEKNNVTRGGGFVHVPYVPSQVVLKSNQPSMSSTMITQGLEEIVKAMIDNKSDKKIVGGSEH